MITLPIVITLGTVILLFIAFAKQLASVELLALTAVSFLVATQILTTQDLLSVFSNPAAMTVAAMFILSASLEKTGVIDFLGKFILGVSSKSNILAMACVFSLVFVGSFFVNNTSIVLIMIPVMIALAHNISLSASKLLLPLSYVSILGGTCTLIGTSTNLLVDGVAQNMGIPAFGMFEIMVPGLIMAGVGGLYLLLIGRKLLPDRESLSEFFDQRFKRQYITQISVSEASKLAGKTLKDAGFVEENGYQPIRLIKKQEDIKKSGFSRIFGGSEIARIFREKIESKDYAAIVDMESVMEIGDRLVLMTSQRQILNQDKKEQEQEQEEAKSFEADDVVEDTTITMEGIVAPDSTFAGKLVRQLHLSEIYDVHILAVHRHKGQISLDFDDVMLSVGDTLLLRGKESELKLIFDNDELLNLSKPALEPYDYKKAPLAIVAVSAAVLLAAFNIVPIAGGAFMAAVFVVMTGCIKNGDAYKALHGEVLLLIYAMLAISVAMERTGSLQFIVQYIISYTQYLAPFIVISILYLLTSMITEVFSNNAAAVMLTPIAIGMAQQLDSEPKAFAAAIMLGASASFATPIGYQTNTLVYNAGGYHFSDYLKVGVPMNILLWITASLVIPWYWNL